MGTESHQPLLQSNEEEGFQSQNERQQVEKSIGAFMEQKILNFKQQKSLEILKSAILNFTSNTKFMFLMILSTIPFFAVMIIYEVEIQTLITDVSELLIQPAHSYVYDFVLEEFEFHDESEQKRKSFQYILQLVPFYLVLSPLLELFSLTMIISIAAKVYAGEKESTLKEITYEVFYQKNKFKGAFITSVLVQLLSTSTLVGVFWTLVNHSIITSGFYYYETYLPSGSYVSILSKGFHAVVFVALLYKFLGWSSMWNMSIVISVLEEEVGIDALEMSAYCGKHCKQTGFQLMLVFFVYGVILRLPFLLAGMWNVNVGVIVIALVVVLFCLGNLLKWVAFVLYFYDCKAHILLKKVDEEVGKAVKAGDVC